VLDTQADLQARMPRRGDVTGSEDPGRTRLEVLIDDDPIADVQPSLLGQASPWFSADANDDEIALDPRAAGSLDRFDRGLASKCCDPPVRDELDAVFGVQVAIDAADLGPEHAL
jgi:hypothetical protein